MLYCCELHIYVNKNQKPGVAGPQAPFTPLCRQVLNVTIRTLGHAAVNGNLVSKLQKTAQTSLTALQLALYTHMHTLKVSMKFIWPPQLGAKKAAGGFTALLVHRHALFHAINNNLS